MITDSLAPNPTSGRRWSPCPDGARRVSWRPPAPSPSRDKRPVDWSPAHADRAAAGTVQRRHSAPRPSLHHTRRRVRRSGAAGWFGGPSLFSHAPRRDWQTSRSARTSKQAAPRPRGARAVRRFVFRGRGGRRAGAALGSNSKASYPRTKTRSDLGQDSGAKRSPVPQPVCLGTPYPGGVEKLMRSAIRTRREWSGTGIQMACPIEPMRVMDRAGAQV